MKYYILVVGLYLSLFTINAQNQVGIGTIDPQGILHIDANKDTQGSSNTDDDVIILPISGNVGIAKPLPTEKLHIKGKTLLTGDGSVSNDVETRTNYSSVYLKYGNATSSTPKAMLDIEAEAVGAGLRIDNGTQTAGSTFIPILGTDASGNAVWTDLPVMANVAEGKLNGNMRIFNASSETAAKSTYYNITTQNLTIPAGGGLWLIYAKILVGSYRASGTVSESRGTKYRDMFIHLRNASTSENIASSMVYPETTGNHIGSLQLTHLYDAGGSTAPAISFKIEVKSDHQDNSSNPTSSNTAGYTCFKTFSDGFWTTPQFFAIRIDHQN